ncbi:MAG: WG repeat-containing protein [Lachnospiraceae bacterium]|nr:WG repeat-containing protein [Lachnospiraceae bacterium]
MKGKKLLLVVLVAAFLVLGWGLAMRKPEKIDYVGQQNDLVAKADKFMGKKLYIRAIPLYQEALRIETTDEAKTSIQEKLMQAYLADEDPAQYLELIKIRAEAGTASEEEYMMVANAYLAEDDLTTALGIIRKGVGVYDSQALKDMYYANRYPYTVTEVAFDEIKPSVQSTMPAFDGSKWGYINAQGKTVIPFIYDYASEFTQYGYAVVKKNDKYYVITAEQKDYSIDDGEKYPMVSEVKYIVSSRILAKREGKYSILNLDFEPLTGLQFEDLTMNSCGCQAVKTDGSWKFISNDAADIGSERFEDVAISSIGCVFENNVGMLKKNGVWHRYTISDNVLTDCGDTYANAKAPESGEYIAVANESGKWGFISQTGELVIDYRYEDAISFSDNVTAVKENGVWTFISMAGKTIFDGLVVDEVMPSHNGVILAKEDDRNLIIRLGYYE